VALAPRQIEVRALNDEDLSGVRKIDIADGVRAGPNPPLFQAAVGFIAGGMIQPRRPKPSMI